MSITQNVFLRHWRSSVFPCLTFEGNTGNYASGSPLWLCLTINLRLTWKLKLTNTLAFCRISRNDDTWGNGQLPKSQLAKTFWSFYVQVDFLASWLCGGWPFLLVSEWRVSMLLNIFPSWLMLQQNKLKCLSMDKRKLTGLNLSRVFNYRCGRVST